MLSLRKPSNPGKPRFNALPGDFEHVLLLTFSEFGRRVAENANGGTDHGAAAPMFVLGGAVKPGLFGKYPSLVDLDQDDDGNSI
jgi:uncharacterized protein (DUF1501 family)